VQLKGVSQPKAVLNLASRRGDASPVVRNFVKLVAASRKEFSLGRIRSHSNIRSRLYLAPSPDGVPR
jgi:hypothetical protein